MRADKRLVDALLDLRNCISGMTVFADDRYNTAIENAVSAVDLALLEATDD